MAGQRGTTVKALVEAGLRRELRELAAPVAFRLRDASFRGGRGLRPEAASLSWEALRELWSADRDFGRFEGLRVRNPLVERDPLGG